MTNVLTEIALPDGAIGPDDELDAFSARLGGFPSWLVRDSSLTIDCFTCRICSSRLYLVVQFDSPLKQDADRVIYVFCCNSRKCSQDARGWRVVIQERRREGKSGSQGTPLWDSLMGDENSISKGLERVSLSDELALPRFPAHHLHIIEELLPVEKASTKLKYNHANMDVSKEFDPEPYEKVIRPVGFDKTIDVFQRRACHHPRQCVRISKEPLLFHASDSIPKHGVCQECGNGMSFEFQLMPAILSLLPVEREEYIRHLKSPSSHPLVANGMEWATVLFYTCSFCSHYQIVIQVEGEFEGFELKH